MAAGLVIPVCGAYVGSWDADLFGVLSDEGFEIQATLLGHEIAETDGYGLTLIEAIYRGQNWKLRLRGLMWDQPGLLSSLQMFGNASGMSQVLSPMLANLGDRWTKSCQTLLLNALLPLTSGGPSTPSSLTSLFSGISPNSQTSFQLTSKLREMPLEFVLFPYTTQVGEGEDEKSVTVPFTVT
jgi:hypothetical protein